MPNDLLINEGSGPKKVKTLELSSNIHLPQSMLLDADGNEVIGQSDAVAHNGTDASTTLMALLKKGNADIASMLAAILDTNAISNVRLTRDGNRSQLVILSFEDYEIGSASDQMVTMQSAAGVTVTTGITDYAVTASRRLRLTSFAGHLTMKTGTSTGGAPIKLRLRATASGAVSTSSARLLSWTAQASGAPNGVNGFQSTPFPEGIEFGAGARVGFSALYPGWVSGTSVPLITGFLVGYEYIP